METHELLVLIFGLLWLAMVALTLARCSAKLSDLIVLQKMTNYLVEQQLREKNGVTNE